MATETVTETTKTCQECNNGHALYQCPRCSTKTCCLTCCKAHKVRLQCSGKRNRTEYLPLARMSDKTIQSDYHFLEDVLHSVDGGKRLLHQVGAAANGARHETPNENDKDDEPVHAMLRIQETDDVAASNDPSPKRQRKNNNKWQRLVQQAQERATTLMLMPVGMQRHATNTSWYQTKTDTLYWKVDFQIHTKGKPDAQILTMDKLDEHIVIEEPLKEIFPSLTKDHHLLLKRLPCPSNRPVFVEIDRDATLKMALKDQTVIEYPTIDVVPTELLTKFPQSIEEL